MVGHVQKKKFCQIDISDSFFNTLKNDYQEFADWFQRKADKEAYVIFNDEQRLDAFLHLKVEDESEIDNTIVPALPAQKRLKIATLKVAEGGQGYKYGEGLLKIAFDIARQDRVSYLYVTVFSKHDALIYLLKQMGFEKHGIKTSANGVEDVLIHHTAMQYNPLNPLASYPYIPCNPTKSVRIVPIEAEYHSLLFPASDLQGAIHKVDEYIPASNAIRKIYLAKGVNAEKTSQGDLLLFYRKKHEDEPGSSMYKSAVTTLGVVENVYREGHEYHKLEGFLKITGKRTVFPEEELIQQYKENRRIVIQFLYLLSFGKGNNINCHTLVEKGIINMGSYWGFLPISNDNYRIILKEAGVDENYFID